MHVICSVWTNGTDRNEARAEGGTKSRAKEQQILVYKTEQRSRGRFSLDCFAKLRTGLYAAAVCVVRIVCAHYPVTTGKVEIEKKGEIIPAQLTTTDPSGDGEGAGSAINSPFVRFLFHQYQCVREKERKHTQQLNNTCVSKLQVENL